MQQPEVQLDLLEQSDCLTEQAKALIRPRAELLIHCEMSEVHRAAAIKTCREGTPETADSPAMPGYLWFLCMFAWIYEERNIDGFQKLPFVPYPYQVIELAVMYAALQGGIGVVGKKQVKLWLKSRDMGLTWLVLAIFVWDWLFNRGIFHVGSRNEKEVDYLGETGSIFFKLRFLIYNLPKWMLDTLAPDLEDKKLLLSYDNGNVAISGESANPNFGTGKRRKAILADEISKWEHDREAYRSMSQASNTLFLVGTPKGYGNLYSEIARGKSTIKAEVRKVHWMEHPLKSKDAELVDGKWTSPWYRDQCANLEPDMIAGELDLSFDSSLKGLVFASIYGIGHQKSGLKPIPGVILTRTWDLGGYAATILFQVDKWRRVHVLGEVVTEGETLGAHAQEVVDATERLSAKCKNVILGNDATIALSREDCGDPAGNVSTKMNQIVPEYETLRADHSIDVDTTAMDGMSMDLRVRARIVAIENLLRRYIISGNAEIDGPAFWIDVDACPFLDEALRGGYRRRLDKSGNVMDAIALRRPYTDVIDALGYGVIFKLGVPESIKREMVKKSEEEKEDERAEELESLKRSRC